ncbi:hypothetical protein BHE74_00053569, partial [Ensete ventricosum]
VLEVLSGFEEKRSGVRKKIPPVSYSGGYLHLSGIGGHAAKFNGCGAFGRTAVRSCVERRLHRFPGSRSARPTIASMTLRVTNAIFGLAYIGCQITEVAVHIVLGLMR